VTHYAPTGQAQKRVYGGDDYEAYAWHWRPCLVL